MPASIQIKNGVPDFTVVDPEKWLTALKQRRCGICGLQMHGRVWFVGGPLCAHNRLFSDHPMHEDCAKYALQVCPFLALPKMMYKKRAEGIDVSVNVSDEKPPRFMLGKARGYRATIVQGEPLLQASPWEALTWWEGGHEIHLA